MNLINIEEIILKKNISFLKNFPLLFRKFIFFLINKILYTSRVNGFISSHNDKIDIEFIDEIFEYLDFSYAVSKKDRDKIPSEGSLIVIANHPLGGLDGLVLLKMISEVRKDVKIIVNDVLMNLDNLKNLFLPFDIFSQSPQKSNILEITKAIKNQEVIIFFPAGEVSRFGINGIKDSSWHKGFLTFAQKYNVPIQPVYINAKNSKLFYFVSLISKKFSMFLLPKELFNKAEKTITIKIGNTISPKVINSGISQEKLLLKLIRKHLYAIGKNKKEIFKTEKNIIHPLDRKTIRNQLQKGELLSVTEDGKAIFLIDYYNNYDVIMEIARLREITFRKVGEGTGYKYDRDIFDKLYKHIVLWDETELEIVGSYRIGVCKEVIDKSGINGLYTSTLFNFSNKFADMLPYSIELGRSFVQAKYWNSNALDYLWQGIGAYLFHHPEVSFMFGGVSLSSSYSTEARNLMVYFYRKWFGDTSNLVVSKNRFEISNKNIEELQAIFNKDDYKEELKLLKSRLKVFGYSIPTLYKQYSELCDAGGVKFLDFGIDNDFQSCIDGFILVNVDMIKEAKKKRYIKRNSAIQSVNLILENTTQK
jgi:putative hemolysin